MNKTFELNGKTYTAKELGFDEFCLLEENGVPMEKIGDRPFSAIRAYVAICCDTTTDEAGKLIEEHVINGGKINAIGDAFGERLQESGFFRAFIQGAMQKDTTSEETQKKETKKNTKA